MRQHRTSRFIIFTILDDKKMNRSVLVTESEAPPTATFKDFLSTLPRDECRFAMYDFLLPTAPGTTTPQNKIGFILWVPDRATMRSKMVFASQREEVKKILTGGGTSVVSFSASEASHLDYDALLDALMHRSE